MKDDIGNGFGQYRRVILKELERLNEGQENLRTVLESVRRDDLPGMRQEFRDALQEMKTEILMEVRPSPAMQAAKITGTWQFYAILISSVTAVIVALIALLQ